MKAIDIVNELFSWAPGDYTRTCDTLKAGSPEQEVTRVAVCCFPEAKAIREAAAWGAQLFITHEPLDFNEPDTPVARAKRALIESTGMTFYRYHDHPHRAPVDLICEGELKTLGLTGTFKGRDAYGNNRLVLDTPVTPRELASHIQRALGVAHVRICGVTDTPCTHLALGWGAPDGILEDLVDEEVEIVVVGEACEWKMAEYARDAAQLGFTKALLLVGHCGSERDGMRHIAGLLQEKLPRLEVRFFDSDEVYTYPER